MRVTNQMMTNNAVQYMTDNLSKLNDLQVRVASQKAFQNPSDNPSGFSASLSLKSTMTTNSAYIDTINVAGDWMDATEFSMGQMGKVAARAQVLVVQGLNDTLSNAERSSALATEVDGLLQSAVQIANTTHQGNYLFSGFHIQDKPFTVAADNNSVVSFTLPKDTNGKLQREIGPNQTVTVNVDGQAAFKDLFKALIDVRNALNANPYDSTVLRTAYADLNKATDIVSTTQTSLGARQRQVQTSADRMEKTQIELKSLLSQKEDANMAEAISMMSNQEAVYKTVLEVGQRAVSALNLFDYLR